MGLNFSLSRKNPAPAQPLQVLFGVHFPRLFAYVRCHLRDDEAVGRTVVEAFCRALARHHDAPDQDFRLAVFAAARHLCAAAATGNEHPDDPLNPREREVLSLLFDAQLSRGEIGRLLKMKEQTVTSAVLRGLKKLRSGASPAAMAAYLRLA